jgi:hypothetical protein
VPGTVRIATTVLFRVFGKGLIAAEVMELQNIVRKAHQCPFAAYFVDAAQENLTEPARLLNLSEHRFNNRLARCLNRFSCFGLQLASHTIDTARSFRQRPAAAGLFVFSVLLPLGSDVSNNAAFRVLVRIQLL